MQAGRPVRPRLTMSDPFTAHPQPEPGDLPLPPMPPVATATTRTTPEPERGPLITAVGRLADSSTAHEQRTYALLMHASIVLMHVLPLVSFVVPLAMWLARRRHAPFLNDHGREAVNFHLSIALYWLVGLALTPLCGVGAGVIVAAYLLALVGGVMACVAASRAEYFRYPMCVRFIA